MSIKSKFITLMLLLIQGCELTEKERGELGFQKIPHAADPYTDFDIYCSPLGVSYFRYRTSTSLTPQVDRQGKLIPCERY